jgi:hypothetical protein
MEINIFHLNISRVFANGVNVNDAGYPRANGRCIEPFRAFEHGQTRGCAKLKKLFLEGDETR